MTLSSLISDVTGSERTLTVYDATDSMSVTSVKNHFEVQKVTIEEASTPEGPNDFVVLHDDGEFLAGGDLEELRDAVEFQAGLLDAKDFHEAKTPDVLKHVSNTTFTSHGKRRMILASREIEEQAWSASGGELHAGFQQLSLLQNQYDMYSRIADRDVDIHVYGVPDWEPPEEEWLTVHATDAPEIRDSWFVVYDSPTDNDCALVSEQVGPNEFDGFWTYEEDIISDILGHLRSEYS